MGLQRSSTLFWLRALNAQGCRTWVDARKNAAELCLRPQGPNVFFSRDRDLFATRTTSTLLRP